MHADEATVLEGRRLGERFAAFETLVEIRMVFFARLLASGAIAFHDLGEDVPGRVTASDSPKICR